jgi:hypothetical protein
MTVRDARVRHVDPLGEHDPVADLARCRSGWPRRRGVRPSSPRACRRRQPRRRARSAAPRRPRRRGRSAGWARRRTRRPLGIEADAVGGGALAEVGPHPPVDELARVGDRERGERWACDSATISVEPSGRHGHAVGEPDVVGHDPATAVRVDDPHTRASGSSHGIAPGMSTHTRPAGSTTISFHGRPPGPWARAPAPRARRRSS